MKSQYPNCFLILLVTAEVVSLYASTLLSLQQYNDQDTSLEKCIRQLDILQEQFGLMSLRSRKISGDNCHDIVENILKNIPTSLQDSPNMHFGSISEGGHRYAEEYKISANDENNSNNNAFGSLGNSVAYSRRSKGQYGRYSALKKNKISPQNFAAIHSALSEILAHHNRLGAAGISQRQDGIRLDIPAASFSVYSPSSTPKDKLDTAHIQNDDLISVPYSKPLLANTISPPKRSPANWLNVVRTEVAKRRRQTLSINNALMALTDMVMEHGRDKLMRNRDNLRYHMYIQG